MPKNGTVAYVTNLPDCDFASMDSDGDQRCQNTARYDFRTSGGPWANGCEEHYKMYRIHSELGLGKGQRLITERERKEL